MKRYLLLLILLAGILLRWYAIDWTLPLIFHPDETRLLYAVQDISWDDPNPHFFAYGSLPIYLLKITQISAETIAKWLGMPPHVNFFLVGRSVSAFFGSLTLIVLYLLGKRFFSRQAGLLAAAFLAFTVLHIQLSHFLTVDVMMTFFVVLALYFLASLAEGTHPVRDYLLSGIIIGCALATKVSALPLYGVFFIAHLFYFRWAAPPRRSSFRIWSIFILALLLSGVASVVCEPYALLDFKEFYRQVKEQSDMVRGITQPPYVIQYEQTPRYFYQLKQLVLYSMGWPLGGLTLCGTVSLFLLTLKDVTRLFKPRLQERSDVLSGIQNLSKGFSKGLNSRILILIFLWILPVFWLVGGFKVKFLRYMLPLLPFFCLLGAIWIEYLLERFSAWKTAIYAIVALTIAYSAFYSLAFVSIYRQEDPRIQASRWIYEHIEEGRTLLTETWEFAPIVPVDEHYPGQYRLLEVSLYDPDSDAKIKKIAGHLSETDVIVLATRRLYGSILRVPERYPLTANYYKLLFDGTLGFRPAKTFTLYPSLFGISFNDDFADESFSVYDHPKTILFKKIEKFSAEELFMMMATQPPFDAAALLDRLHAYPEREQHYQPVADEEGADRSVSEQVTEAPPLWGGLKGGSAQWQVVLVWLMTIEFLSLLLAFPITSLIFRRLPDAGYALSKATGILLPSYGVWLGVSLHVCRYSQGAILTVIALLLLGSASLFWKYASFFREVMNLKWKTFLIYEAIFLGSFSAFLLFRAYNPDIFWSESSMDFSFLNVLVRTETLPPPDPWISGFPLNYYYFGHYIVATLTKLTGIASQMTYNLAFALFPALVIVEVFGLLYNLTKRYAYGAIGVLFSTIIGNLDGFLLLTANWRHESRLLDLFIGNIPVLDHLIGKESYYRFFRPAHEVIPYTVHEFPFWTFIFVDLHAHLLNMPFLIAVLSSV